MTNFSAIASLATTPIIPPPLGTVSNFEDPETRTELPVVVTSTIMGISLVFYFNRVYVKLCLMRRVTWDDATLLIAVVRMLLNNTVISCLLFPVLALTVPCSC